MQYGAGAILSFFLFIVTSTVLADGPMILEQPTNTSVIVGGTAMFSVTATGASPLHYFWSFNNANIPNATNSALTLTNVTPSQAGNYSVFIMNSYGSTNSSIAKLTVYAATNQFFDDFKGPSLNPIWQTNLPDAVSGSLGTGAGGNAAYIGAPNYTFALLDSNTVLNMHSVMGPFQRVGWSSSTVFLGTNFSYEARFNTGLLSPTTSMDGFLEIWIMNATNHDLYFMVSTYEGESDTYVFFGTSVYGLYGANPYTFADNTWYRLVLQCLPGQFIHASLCDDDERELFGTDIAAADGSVFGAGYNIVIAQNIGTETNVPASVAVDYVSVAPKFSPAIIHQPKNQTVAAGANVTISVTAEGAPPLAYQWSFDGTSLTGATNATLTIANFQSVNSGAYSVAVTNAFGSVVSSNALVSTSAAPMILEQPGNKSVPAGVTVTFSVTAAGSLPLNYYWSFNNANIPGATNSTLVLTNVMLSQAGSYSVFITNAHGSTNSAIATLTIIKNLPGLAIVSSSGAFSISWPTNPAGFVLVTSTNLLSGNWVRVTASPSQSGNKYVEPIVLSGTGAFFRLEFSGN